MYIVSARWLTASPREKGVTFKNTFVKAHAANQRPQTLDLGLDLDWYGIVEFSTELDLTFRQIVVQTLTGLALASRSRTADRIGRDMFGLWAIDLIGDLLWQAGKKGPFGCNDDRENTRQPDGYAPSWSWASVTGQVGYDNDVRSVGGSGDKH